MTSRMEQLRALAAKTVAKTREVREEVKETRAARKEEAAKHVESAPREELVLEPKPKKTNSVDVQKWFSAGVRELRGDRHVQGRWTVKERKLAKLLLDDYGSELVEAAVAYFCKHWKTYVENSKGRISGDPTVNLLWAMREQVFPAVQSPDTRVRSRRTSDEYDPETDTGSGIGR